MYFDALFEDFPVNTLNGTRAAIRVMNSLGVTPVVSSRGTLLRARSPLERRPEGIRAMLAKAQREVGGR